MAYLREALPVILLAAVCAALVYGAALVAYLLETTP